MNDSLLKSARQCIGEITIDDYDDRTLTIIAEGIKELEEVTKSKYINISESFYKPNPDVLEIIKRLEEQEKKLTVINEYSNEPCPTCGEYKTKTWNEQILVGDEVETGFLICRNPSCVKYNRKIQIN